MPAYLIANIRVKDPAKFAAYREPGRADDRPLRRPLPGRAAAR